MNNTKTNTYLSLFTPSGIGIVLYSAIAGLVVFLHQFKAIEEYMQLPQNFQILPAVLKWLDHALMSLIGETKTQSLVVGLFWAFVGLGVYVFLQGAARFMLEIGEGIDERKYFWPQGTDRNKPLRDALKRFIFRFVAGVALILAVFGPLTRVLGAPVWKDFLGPSLPLQLVVWYAVIWVMLYICNILLRLVVLKPRLFG